MANRHMRRCSTSLIIWKMQIEITVRYHLTLARMAFSKKNTDTKCWDVEKRGPSDAVVCFVENVR